MKTQETESGSNNGEGKVCTLSPLMKAVGIGIICLLFACMSFFCLSRHNGAYYYNFTPESYDMKTASPDGTSVVASYNPDDYSFSTNSFMLPAADYMLNVVYSSTVDAAVLVQGNNDCVFEVILPNTYGASLTMTDARLKLPHGTDKGKMKLHLSGEGEVRIDSLYVSAQRRIYNDFYAYIVVAFLLSLAGIVFIIVFNSLKLTAQELIYLVALGITVIVVNIPYMTKGTYYEIDTQAHMKRIEAFAQGLRDGQFPVIVGPNYANQYGELVVLQPGLFLFLPALLRLMNVSMPVAYNIYMLIVNIVTAFAVCAAGKKMFTSLRWAIIAAIIYLIEPFRLLVMLNLGAGCGMGTALIFVPMLMVGLHETMNNNGRGWKYISVGLWGLICSHIMGFAVSALTMVFYILFHFKKLSEKGVFVSLLKAAFSFILLSVGVLAPFLRFYVSDWNRTALQWTDFYRVPFDLKSELFNVIALIILIISYVKVRNSQYYGLFIRGILMIGFATVLMSMCIFPWFLFKNIKLIDYFLSMMQYPSRFHFITVVSVSFAAACAMGSVVDSKKDKKDPLIIAIGTVLFIGLIINFAYYYTRPKLFTDVVSGEINTLMEDYLPGGTMTEWYATDTGDFSDYDAVKAYSYTKDYTHIDCTYTSANEGEYMEFPLFYYDGYYAHDGSGQPLKVEKGTKNRVRVYLKKTDEPEELCVRYRVKKIYTWLFIFSLIVGGVTILSGGASKFMRVYRRRKYGEDLPG